MGMEKAYKSSGKIFEQVTKRANPALVEQLKAIQKGEIVVVKGVHDHIEKLLDTIHVPYALIDSSGVPAYNGGRVMFVNCMDYSSGGPSKATADFVEAGGRLVTTDWALGLVSKAFPGRLYKTAETGNDVVEVKCSHDIGRNFIGLNYTQCHPKWWLEGSSHVYKTGDGVLDLIVSEEMKNKYGQNHIAVAFTHGKGEVFHFISHLELQRTHLRSKQDKGTLEDFLAKVEAYKTGEMPEANFAELEAAYSTLNTLAYLCSPLPILYEGGGKSRLLRPGGAPKSVALLK